MDIGISLLSEDYASCPICDMDCRMEEEHHYSYFLKRGRRVFVFFCFNPLAKDCPHYYSHIVEKSDPKNIVAHKFYIDLGNKGAIITNDYQSKSSFIRYDYEDRPQAPLEFSFLLIPDFPHLTLLKKKLRTVLTFA